MNGRLSEWCVTECMAMLHTTFHVTLQYGLHHILGACIQRCHQAFRMRPAKTWIMCSRHSVTMYDTMCKSLQV